MKPYLFPYLSHCHLQEPKPVQPLSKDEPRATPPVGPEKPSYATEWEMLTETEMIPTYGSGGLGKAQKKKGKPEGYKVGKTRPRYTGARHPVHTQNPLYLCMCPNCQEVVAYNKAMLRANEPCPSCEARPRTLGKVGRPAGSVGAYQKQLWERAGWYTCELATRRSLSLTDFLAECEIAGILVPDTMAVMVIPHIARSGFSETRHARTARPDYTGGPKEKVEARQSPFEAEEKAKAEAEAEQIRSQMRDIEIDDGFDETPPCI